MEIIGLSKEKAVEVDELLIKIVNARPDVIGLTSLDKVVPQVDCLKGKDNNYIQGLLYLARQLPKTIPNLFSGEDLLKVNHTALKQFLYTGGFKKIYADSKIKPWQKKDWWKEQILKWVLTALCGALLGYIIGRKDGRTESLKIPQQQTIDTLLKKKQIQ